MARTLIKTKNNEDAWQAFLKMKPAPIVTFELITPEKAKEYLETNKSNRSVFESNLDIVKMAMEQGKFFLTGQTIIFGKSGKLLDGQHRLLGVVLSKRPQVFPVVRNIPDEYFKVIDTGRTRRAGDVLSIDGITNPMRIAAIIKFAINFKSGRYYEATKGGGKGNARITNDTVSTFASKNKTSLYESYPCGYNKDNKLISPHMLTGFHYIVKSIDHGAADDFCDKVSRGVDLSKGSPITQLRQELLEDIRSRRPMRPIERLALLCKAWNFYRDKKTNAVLKWDRKKDEFPKPI